MSIIADSQLSGVGTPVHRELSQACQLRGNEQGTEAGPTVGVHRAELQGRHQEPEADRRRAGHQRGSNPQAREA